MRHIGQERALCLVGALRRLFCLYYRFLGLLKLGYVVADAEYLLSAAVNIQDRFIGPGNPHALVAAKHVLVLIAHIARGVERYVICKDGKMRVENGMPNPGFGINADSPKAGRDGFTTPQIDIGEGRHVEVKEEDISKAFFVPKLCNQCDNPPCVQVCPVGATYKTADGVVLVDRSWCIGCGYCIMGCPYGVRFFHPLLKVAEKCNFCYHRITKGMKTACVQSCPFGARQIGNLKDPNDPVTRTIMYGRVGVLKSEYGTKPQVYYLALDREVR